MREALLKKYWKGKTLRRGTCSHAIVRVLDSIEVEQPVLPEYLDSGAKYFPTLLYSIHLCLGIKKKHLYPF